MAGEWLRRLARVAGEWLHRLARAGPTAVKLVLAAVLWPFNFVVGAGLMIDQKAVPIPSSPAGATVSEVQDDASPSLGTAMPQWDGTVWQEVRAALDAGSDEEIDATATGVATETAARLVSQHFVPGSPAYAEVMSLIEPYRREGLHLAAESHMRVKRLISLTEAPRGTLHVTAEERRVLIARREDGSLDHSVTGTWIVDYELAKGADGRWMVMHFDEMPFEESGMARARY